MSRRSLPGIAPIAFPLRALAVETAEQRRAALETWEGAAALLEEDVRALRDGIAGDRAAPRPANDPPSGMFDARLTSYIEKIW